MPSHKKDMFYFLRTNGLVDEANRIADCGIPTIFFVNDETGKVQPTKKLCGSRWCPVCGKRWRNAAAAKIDHIIKTNTGNPLRFITLTQIAREGESLESAAERMLSSWDKLRRSEWWKANTEGAVAKLDIAWNGQSLWWHYHLHVLVKTRWLSRAALSKRWKAITNGAWMVDVRPINVFNIRDLSKYMAKLKRRPSTPLRELVKFLDRKHAIKFYGCFRGLQPIDFNSSPLKGYRRFGGIDKLFKSLYAGEDSRAVLAIARHIIHKMPGFLIGEPHRFGQLHQLVTAMAT